MSGEIDMRLKSRQLQARRLVFKLNVQSQRKFDLVLSTGVSRCNTIVPYLSNTGCSTIATTLQGSFFPVIAHSSSTASTVSFIAFHLRHSQMQSAAQTRKRSRNMRPMETFDSLCSALAVSSIKDVSRPEHSSLDKSLPFCAERAERDGTGKMEELKLAAISRRVSFISALSISNGFSRISSSLALRSARVGRVVLSLISESSNPVGTLTFSKADRDGTENSGTEMVIPRVPVTPFGRQLSHNNVQICSAHVQLADSRLDDIVRRRDITLDTRTDRIEAVRYTFGYL